MNFHPLETFILTNEYSTSETLLTLSAHLWALLTWEALLYIFPMIHWNYWIETAVWLQSLQKLYLLRFGLLTSHKSKNQPHFSSDNSVSL
jgi:hypothetical protein